MFQGATAINIDAKGRLSIPTKHRHTLSHGGKSKLVLTSHPHKCLILYPEEKWDPIRSKIMNFSSFDPKLSLWKRLLIGFAEELEMDASGRILISPALREFASIKKKVMLVGQGNHFELWNENEWVSQISSIGSDGDPLPPGMENFAL
ncbi:MAG: division/cell wall cluster transcriptional repressor MraZ [Betaproteobacteria bacterium]|jgi:MraZ protein